MDRYLSRRSLLVQAATVTSAMTLLAACGDDDEAPTATATTTTAEPTATDAPVADPTATTAAAVPTATDVPVEPTATETTVEDPWMYVDFLGREISLPQPPSRIAAEIGSAAALYDMGVQVHAVWGHPANDPEGFADAWGRLPVDSVVNLSTSEGELDLEKAVREQIDLFTFGSTALDDPESYGGFDDIVDLITPIAPIAAWPFMPRLDQSMEAIWDLAAALGADRNSAENRAARQAYVDAIDRLQGLLADRGGLTSFFAYPLADQLYIANPDLWDDVSFFKFLGLEMLPVPEGMEAEWWNVISWEQVGNFQSDTVFMASVSGALTMEELGAHPTFSLHPAMQNDQVGVWSWYFARSPQGITVLIDNVTGIIERSVKVTRSFQPSASTEGWGGWLRAWSSPRTSISG